MTLSDQQIEYISTNLEFYGVTSQELHSDVLDHICTYIENNEFEDFDSAYNQAIQKFGGYAAMSAIERETYLLTAFKKNVVRQKIVYISGFLASFMIFTGLLFKFMHWPYANIITFTGSLVLILIFIPVFFYHKYKLSYQKSISR